MARVILVDDDPAVRSALRPALESLGVQVIGEAGDGLEAVEAVMTLKPDVVLMDLRMPRMGGIEATREIKAAMPYVQVVFVTVYDEPHPTRSAQDVGAYAYLLKDSSPELVREVVVRAAQVKNELEVRHRREA